MFASTDPVEMRRNVTGSSTFAVLTENSNVNGIRVITSNLTFVTSSTSSKSNVLTCSNDHSISESMIIPVSGMYKINKLQVYFNSYSGNFQGVQFSSVFMINCD